MSGDHCLTLVTCGSGTEGRDIARRLVADRLAAGVQLVPISSVYTWEGEVVEDEEVLLICKTRSSLFGEIEEQVNRMHSYDVPPILQISIDSASAPYLGWIDEVTKASSG